MKPEDMMISLEKVKKYLKKKKYNLNFSEFENKVKDVMIKSIIMMNHKELEEEKEYNIRSNNIFDLYGVDIIIDNKFKS